MICEEAEYEFKKEYVGNEDINNLITGEDESFGGDDKDMVENENKTRVIFEEFPDIYNESNETPTVSVNETIKVQSKVYKPLSPVRRTILS